jgi:hypothetical protein
VPHRYRCRTPKPLSCFTVKLMTKVIPSDLRTCKGGKELEVKARVHMIKDGHDATRLRWRAQARKRRKTRTDSDWHSIQWYMYMFRAKLQPLDGPKVTCIYHKVWKPLLNAAVGRWWWWGEEGAGASGVLVSIYNLDCIYTFPERHLPVTWGDKLNLLFPICIQLF